MKRTNMLEFPEVRDVDIAFGGYPKDLFKKVLGVELSREDEKWKTKVNKIFFNGGSLDLNHELSKEYINSGVRMFKAVIGSFEPKHEEKEHVCAVILKNICSSAD